MGTAYSRTCTQRDLKNCYKGLNIKTLLLIILACSLYAEVKIIDKPIVFDKKRVDLSKQYIQDHYGLKVEKIDIQARIIVIHWTALNDLNRSIERFMEPKLPSDRPDIQKASSLNVSSHFIIDTDGTIYRLMDETKMARHVIGLNYSAIGIENVGGEGNVDNLTQAQLTANISLISYLKNKYPSIEYLIGHYEYSEYSDHPLWLEKDRNYRTLKYDPGVRFMSGLRKHFTDLKPVINEQP